MVSRCMTAPRHESLKDLQYNTYVPTQHAILNLEDGSHICEHQHDVCLPASPVVTLLTSIG